MPGSFPRDLSLELTFQQQQQPSSEEAAASAVSSWNTTELNRTVFQVSIHSTSAQECSDKGKNPLEGEGAKLVPTVHNIAECKVYRPQGSAMQNLSIDSSLRPKKRLGDAVRDPEGTEQQKKIGNAAGKVPDSLREEPHQEWDDASFPLAPSPVGFSENRDDTVSPVKERPLSPNLDHPDEDTQAGVRAQEGGGAEDDWSSVHGPKDEDVGDGWTVYN
ncbi:hypothetical protein QFC22_004523 [Naganishia vaughanmartiniae]|uniref:Uncharacterized protein n=1 Tax=Naganishia vaughanmartiniae TaxID=1424756 RepID=A0ACC2X0C9_9TREE|nr:hypothetical protein QFC22_004523 [Naganishia vaughanmartiniae]